METTTDKSGLFHGLDKLKFFISGPLQTVNRWINRFSRLLSLKTRLSKACSLIISCIFSGQMLSSKGKVLFQSALTTWSWISLPYPDSFYLHMTSPLLGFTHETGVLVNPGQCHANQAHSATATRLMEATKRRDNSLLSGPTRPIRPAESQRFASVCAHLQFLMLKTTNWARNCLSCSTGRRMLGALEGVYWTQSLCEVYTEVIKACDTFPQLPQFTFFGNVELQLMWSWARCVGGRLCFFQKQEEPSF